MGVELRTSLQNAPTDIAPFWRDFYRDNIQEKIPNQKTGEVLGLYCEYESDHTGPYTLVAGCEVTLVGDVPNGFVVKHLPAAKYAVFEVSGEFPHKLMEAWEWIWEGHLKRTFAGDFEVYPLGFHPNDNPDLLLYIAID